MMTWDDNYLPAGAVYDGIANKTWSFFAVLRELVTILVRQHRKVPNLSTYKVSQLSKTHRTRVHPRH